MVFLLLSLPTLPPHSLLLTCLSSSPFFGIHNLKVRKINATCYTTTLQNELNSDVACFTTHIKPVLRQIRLPTALLLTTCSAAILQNKLHVFTEALLWFNLVVASTNIFAPKENACTTGYINTTFLLSFFVFSGS